MVDITSVLGALSTLATGGSVSLGTVTFVGFEVPPKINFGGTTVLVVHKFPGGARVIDSMGDDPVTPDWMGTFTGPFAAVRARQVNAMRLAAQPVPLSFGPFSAQVVIKRFSADYQRNGFWIPYRISCEVLPPQPDAASIGGAALAGLIGDDAASALASVADAASQVADVAATAAAQASSVLARLTPLTNIVGMDLTPINYALDAGSGIVTDVTNLAEAPAAAAQSYAQLQSAASGIGSALGAVGAGISSINGTAAAVGGGDPVASVNDLANAGALTGAVANLAQAGAFAARAAINAGTAIGAGT